MIDMLECKICGYKSKQLFQHLKSVHGITTHEYRKLYGNVQVQLNFTAPSLGVTIDENISKIVKNSYNKLRNKLDDIVDIYDISTTRNMLLGDEYNYTKYMAKTKYRTLQVDNITLYKSILVHTSNLEDFFKKIGKGKNYYNFSKRLLFIVDMECNIDKLKCKCGKNYTWNKFCRYCIEPKMSQLGKPMPEYIRTKIRIATLKYIEKMNGTVMPRYNIDSIPILERVANELGITDLMHAENGGEFVVPGLGYYVDGYSPSNNIVIEFDEKHHFNTDGSMRDRDIIRQNAIVKHLNCKFIRIRYDGKYEI